MATDPNREFSDDEASGRNQSDDQASLNAKADRCRRLAAGISDRQAAEVLKGMATNYQAAADRLSPKD